MMASVQVLRLDPCENRVHVRHLQRPCKPQQASAALYFAPLTSCTGNMQHVPSLADKGSAAVSCHPL